MACSEGQQASESFLQSPSCDGISMIADASIATAIPQPQRVENEVPDLPGKPRTLDAELLNQFLGPSQGLLQTLLMYGVKESVVRRPAVMRHSPGVIHSQHFGRHVHASTGTDHIHREEIGDEAPQPVQSSADLPAGLVGIHRVSLRNHGFEGVIHRLGPLAGSANDVGCRSTGQVNVPSVLQEGGDVAIGQPELVLQQCDQSLSVGTDLRRGCAQSVGSLKLVSRLEALATAGALADVEIEPPENSAAGNLDLKLLSDVRLPHTPAAGGTTLRRFHRNDLVRRPIGGRESTHLNSSHNYIS